MGMSKSLAVVFEFEEPIQPYSDVEGLITRVTEAAGLNRQGTVVSEDRHRLYVTLKENGFQTTKGDTVTNERMSIIEREIDGGFAGKNVVKFDVTYIDASLLYHSAAVAAKED